MKSSMNQCRPAIEVPTTPGWTTNIFGLELLVVVSGRKDLTKGSEEGSSEVRASRSVRRFDDSYAEDDCRPWISLGE